MGSLQVPRVAIFTHKHPNLGGGVCHAGVAIPYTCRYPPTCAYPSTQDPVCNSMQCL
jgi:hypothetical protein